MSARDPIAPFELDPASVPPGRFELVEPEPAAAPLVPVPPAPPPARSRPWRRLLLWSGGLLAVGLLGLQAYDLMVELFERSVWLGGLAAVLLAGVATGGIGIVGRETLALARLARVEHLRHDAERQLVSEVHGKADALLERIEQLYRERDDTRGALERFHAQASDALTDGERLRLFATTVLGPLDERAYQLVKRSARDVGALTALTPLGLLDSAFVLTRTLAMLRAIARLYGVRPGAAASAKLLRRTVVNVLAADVSEMISDAAVEATGATLLHVLSARIGQGAVNGLLAAKLGLVAMQICRPLPFTQGQLPSLSRLRAELFK